ncbi:hypothetical protein LVJ94_00755 [Pendulispora rubella]|uniref:Uncharacterized protein n=1 Tax=Pendulispora rubella TaxID=2741070 RepID=A0ABZ2L4X0_9BACT
MDDDVCSACYRRELQPREPCSRCGTVAPIRSRPDGVNGYCNKCYLRELHVGRCCICRVRKPIAIRDRGNPVCPGCYRREFASHEKCRVCENVALVAARSPRGEAICPYCYGDRYRPRARCSRCGDVEIVQARDRQNGKPLCAACYRTTVQVAPCTYCRRTSRVMTRTTSGKPVCATCYGRHHAPREKCALCGELEKVKMRLESGRAACNRCYQRELKERPQCALCGQFRVAGKHIRGKPICGACIRRKGVGQSLQLFGITRTRSLLRRARR